MDRNRLKKNGKVEGVFIRYINQEDHWFMKNKDKEYQKDGQLKNWVQIK